MTFTLQYLNSKEEECEIELSVSYSIYNDGIGPYEYWGQKCFDKGNPCVEIEEITYDKETLSVEDVSIIESAIESEMENIIQKCFDDSVVEREPDDY